MKRGTRNKTKPRQAIDGIAVVEQSRGNVFADLELPEPEELLARAQLVAQINSIIAQRKLTQAKAAAVLGIDQPKISALVRGKLAGFSTDRLFRFLNALGSDVEILIRPIGRRRAGARVRVLPSV
ncbi:MAG: helix-turn-helix transcriptional regulator [Pirellulaceae bacterium]